MVLELYVDNKNSTLALLNGLRVAISNANNLNTTGYKSSVASFTTVYAEVVGGALQTRNPQVVGSSMTVGSTRTDFSQGNLGFGAALDVAIAGEGFFITSASAEAFSATANKLYTRSGRFHTDLNNEYLVDEFGRKIFGFEVNANGDIINNELVPIQTNGFTDIGFLESGILVNNFQAAKDAETNGDEAPEQERLYKLALSSFNNKQGLVPVAGGAFRATLASGEPFAVGTSGDGVYGDILNETLEGSNTDIARVSLDLALLNRGLSATQGVLDDINRIVGGLISKLGAL